MHMDSSTSAKPAAVSSDCASSRPRLSEAEGRQALGLRRRQDNAITLPNSWYLIDNTITYEFAPRNSIRMIPYHRLDLSMTYKFKKREKFNSDLNVSVYNAYSRMNPYFLYIDTSGDPYNGDLTIKAKQVSLFPILPSITYNFRF
jgi:hypothetical protein